MLMIMEMKKMWSVIFTAAKTFFVMVLSCCRNGRNGAGSIDIKKYQVKM